MASGASLTLSTIRPLLDALLEHGCSTCGSVPIHYVDEGNNDPSDGILTFNYVASPYCIDNCISAVGGSESDGASTTTVEVVTVTTSETVSTNPSVQAATSSQEYFSTSTGLTTSVLPSAASTSHSTSNGSKLHLSLLTLSLLAAVLYFLVFTPAD